MAVIRRRSRTVVLALSALAALLIFFCRQDASAYRPAPFSPDVRWKKLEFRPSGFNWSEAPEFFPVQSPVRPLPRGPPRELPRVQHAFPSTTSLDALAARRRDAVRATFVRSWRAYKERAWLQDELLPLSGGSKNPFGGWGASLVDCLDTLWIMGLKAEFYEAAAAAVRLDFSVTAETGVNLFETTIRHLGGLLGAYDLSQEPALLAKAVELGEMLYMAFDTPNRMPGFWLTFEDAKTGRQSAGTHDPSAGPTSLGMEFTRLAQLTGEDKYYDAIDRVREFLEDTQESSLLPGMWPAMLNFDRLDVLEDNSFTLGALADSLYEYLPKMYILLGGRDGSAAYETMHRRAMATVIKHVLFRPMLPDRDDILFAGTTFVHEDGIHLVPEGQHLACFAGGMFALGGRVLPDLEEHVHVGERLARGCAWAYAAFPTGIMPEIFGLSECRNPSLRSCWFDPERHRLEHGGAPLAPGFRHARDPRYLLRPEAVESLFVLYRATGKEDLRDAAWAMFESIVRHTEAPFGHAAIKDVTATGETEKEDSMESFWLSETLKYFYLIFSPPDVISLDEYVLNTEAHPFRRT